MVGTTSSPKGNRYTHFQAVRNWLDRAEDQFESGQDMLASATLMLAQAELRLVVEGVMSGDAAADHTEPKKRVRIFPVLRTSLGVAALAACLVLGIVIGRMGNIGVTDPGQSPIMQQSPVIQIADGQDISDTGEQAVADQLPEDETPVLVAEAPTESESPAEDETVTVSDPEEPVYTPPVVNRPRTPVRVSEPVPEPVDVSDVPVEPEVVLTGETGPDDGISSIDESPSGLINPAEVTLNTVRTLTDLLISGDAE